MEQHLVKKVRKIGKKTMEEIREENKIVMKQMEQKYLESMQQLKEDNQMLKDMITQLLKQWFTFIS